MSSVVEQNVLALEVAVRDVMTVQVLDGEHDAVEDGARLGLGQRAATEDVLE